MTLENYSFSYSEAPWELAAVSPGQEYSKIIHCHGALLNGSLPQCEPVMQAVHKPEATSTVSKSRENLHHLTESPHSSRKDHSPLFIRDTFPILFQSFPSSRWNEMVACLQPSFANMAGLAMRLEPDPFPQWQRVRKNKLRNSRPSQSTYEPGSSYMGLMGYGHPTLIRISLWVSPPFEFSMGPVTG